MEWSFIVAAVRRRIRFVVLCALVGALPGLYAIGTETDEYEATATVGIATPTSGAGAISAANQPDRYVVNQLSVVSSTETLSKAAKKLGRGFTAGKIAQILTVEQEPQADIVRITARTGDAKSAAAIANAVATVYIDETAARLTEARQPEIDRLNAKLTDLQTQLDVALANIEAALEPYLTAARNNPNGNGVIPQPEAVAANDVQKRDALTGEYNRVLAAKSDLELSAQSQAANTLIERAHTPSTPAPTLSKLILVGGIVLGGLAGVAVALVLAQLSSKVLDEVIVAQVLGTPVVGAFPRHRSLIDKPLAALRSTPPEARDTLERLSVRAEAMADPEVDHALTIAVVGTQPGAGTTTLTLALARRLSRSGYSVVVVDGDIRTQTISEIFDTSPNAGISAVLAAEIKRPTKPQNYFTETDLPKVEVLGVGKLERREALRRDAIGPILDAARDRGQIVLYDGGALMGSALTLFASKAADVIVLAVPLHDQEQETLAEVADNLPTERSRVLTVTTAPVRRRHLVESAEADAAKD